MAGARLPVRATMTVPEAAKILGISRGLAYELIAAGRFPAPIIRAGRRILVPAAGIDRQLGIDNQAGGQ